MEKCEKSDGICFQDSLQLFSYDDDIRDDINNAWGWRNVSIQKFINLTLLGNITGSTTSDLPVKTKFTLKIKEFRKIMLGIRSTGGCGTVVRVKLYYFVCRALIFRFQKGTIYRNHIILKKTPVPQNGTKVVFGSCSANAVLVSGMGDFKALCHSNGTWSIVKGDMVCWCDKGYELSFPYNRCVGMF